MDPLFVTILAAYLLDLILGDPPWLPHPVRGIGWAIAQGERALRSLIRNETASGWFLVGTIGLGTLGVVATLRGLAWRISPGFGLGCDVILLYACLSTKDLVVESLPVYEALKAGHLPQARGWVSRIVGRDTEELDSPEVIRATVETIGESAMDGIIAPLFYAVLGGVPLACFYKAINTLDSMVGYRSSRYLVFGAPTARVDTWMNAIPARLTAWLLALAAPLIGLSGREALQVTYRDAWRRRENSWIPEAAVAGALGVRLGGVNRYQKVAVTTPFLGDARRPLTADRIPQALELMVGCSFLGWLLALAVRWMMAARLLS